MSDIATDLRLAGITLTTVDRILDEGHVYCIGGTYYAAPLTSFKMGHGGRLPFESRYCRGVIELERDRRRRSR